MAAGETLNREGLALMAQLPRADYLTLVVPARSLSWHQVVLPRVSGVRLRHALCGLLEERLLTDPDNLHLALAPGALPGNTVWVAACDRVWLHAALQAFESAGRRVGRVVPEYEPLSNTMTVTQQAAEGGETAWLVRCASDGVQTLPLSAATGVALEISAVPDHADGVVSTDTATATSAEWSARAHGQYLMEQLESPGQAERLAAAARSRWNLAQFDLISSRRTRAIRWAEKAWADGSGSAAWRPARWGLVALLVSQFFGLQAWAWRERTALQEKQVEVRSLLTRTFPAVTTVVDSPVQMEREVTALRRATGILSPRDMETLLTIVADHLPGGRIPSAIQFSTGELTLRGLPLAPPEADALNRGLLASGYTQQRDGDRWTIRSASVPSTAPSSVKVPR